MCYLYCISEQLQATLNIKLAMEPKSDTDSLHDSSDDDSDYEPAKTNYSSSSEYSRHQYSPHVASDSMLAPTVASAAVTASRQTDEISASASAGLPSALHALSRQYASSDYTSEIDTKSTIIPLVAKRQDENEDSHSEHHQHSDAYVSDSVSETEDFLSSQNLLHLTTAY